MWNYVRSDVKSEVPDLPLPRVRELSAGLWQESKKLDWSRRNAPEAVKKNSESLLGFCDVCAHLSHSNTIRLRSISSLFSSVPDALGRARLSDHCIKTPA